MPDAVAYPLLSLVTAGLVALALVWPQGEGTPSPKPFGHPLAAIGQTSPAEPTVLQVNGPGAGRAAINALRGNPGAKP